MASLEPGRDPGRAWRQGKPLPVHFYTARTLREVFACAVRELGYSDAHVRHAPNQGELQGLLALASEGPGA